MPKFRVLVFPCGSENAIELHDALSCSVNIELWGGSSREDHGRFVFRHYLGGIPFIQQPEFVTQFNEILRKHQIDVVFPTHDTVAQFFAERQPELACRVITADLPTANVCREKRRTYRTFADCAFAPRTYAHLGDVDVFPIFLKPNIGEGGKHTRLAQNAEEAAHALALGPDLIIVEYLPGEELTVDCFTDRHRKLRFIGPRERSRINYGISVHSRPAALTPDVRGIAEEINRRMRMRGLWFFQVKRAADSAFRLMEVSARAAGTMCLYRHLGVNLPLLSVYDAMNLDVEILSENFAIEVDRALFNRFRVGFEYDTIYLDFDDTVVCGGQVHPHVLLLLYQAAREGKSVHLLTRHDGDIQVALRQGRIHTELFTSIRTLGWQEEKHEIIKHGARAIFIDNAFAERKKVKQHLGIPVFDVDAIACLLDWRT